tara:strand:- start:657 stop:944 length:288 start_codon:yes stop_codon:yes gene_type:complete
MDYIIELIISFFQLIFGNILAFVAFYLLTIANIKLFEIWKIQSDNKNALCPKCNNKCSRIQREALDKIRNILSLKTLNWKRYTCYSCYWEGSRWD